MFCIYRRKQSIAAHMELIVSITFFTLSSTHLWRLVSMASVPMASSFFMQRTLLFLLIVSHAPMLVASPWIEADDPFLRSELQFLADRGLIRLPLNSFPVRWSLLADQFANLDPNTLTPAEQSAYRQVQYRLDSERLGRGRSHLTLSWANDAQVGQNGFGGGEHTEYGIRASHEVINKQFAMRFSSGYRQAADSSDHWHFEDSYLAFGARDFTLSLGWLSRWWGPGWQQAFGFGQQATSVPGLSLSYQHPSAGWLGSLWIETLIGKQDNEVDADYLWASRLALRPQSWLQLGSSYKQWFGGDDTIVGQPSASEQGNGMWSADIRLSSPLPFAGAGGLYGEYGHDRQTSINYQLVGVDAQWLVGRESLRLVAEGQESDPQSATGVDVTQPPLWQHKGNAIVDAVDGKRLSFGGYLQLHNDHTISVFLHDNQPVTSKSYQQVVGQYRLPLLAGRVTGNLTSSDDGAPGQDRFSGGVVYEYRFN
jgi:hypothetical protein